MQTNINPRSSSSLPTKTHNQSALLCPRTQAKLRPRFQAALPRKSPWSHINRRQWDCKPRDSAFSQRSSPCATIGSDSLGPIVHLSLCFQLLRKAERALSNPSPWQAIIRSESDTADKSSRDERDNSLCGNDVRGKRVEGINGIHWRLRTLASPICEW